MLVESQLGTALDSAASREVRKTVTVLFCGRRRLDGARRALDPEALRRVMSRYFDGRAPALERHGGAVEKFIGDAVMAVFGVPPVHEDDALRAVRAAAEMRDAVAALTRSSSATRRPRSPCASASTPARSSRAPTRRSSPATPSTSPPGSSRRPRPARSSSARRRYALVARRRRRRAGRAARRARGRASRSPPSGCSASSRARTRSTAGSTRRSSAGAASSTGCGRRSTPPSPNGDATS